MAVVGISYVWYFQWFSGCADLSKAVLMMGKEFFLIKKVPNVLVNQKRFVTLHPQTGRKPVSQGGRNVCVAKIDIASLAQLARARDL